MSVLPFRRCFTAADLNTPTCKDCESGSCPNQLLSSILQEKKLTSGYMGVYFSTKPKGTFATNHNTRTSCLSHHIENHKVILYHRPAWFKTIFPRTGLMKCSPYVLKVIISMEMAKIWLSIMVWTQCQNNFTKLISQSHHICFKFFN